MCMVRICIWLAKEHHISNSNKKTFHGPGYRLVNAVKLSLQSGRNTQLRICIILVIFSCFRNTTDAIVSNYKKTTNIYDIVIFKALSFQNTLIRNYYDLLFFTNHCFTKNFQHSMVKFQHGPFLLQCTCK
jgi:hypothetical protein